jgi:mitogen-activated protein kinase organizer 1
MSGSQDKTIRLWNPHKGLHIKSYSGPHNYEVTDIAIHKSNNQFASVGGDKLAFYWDVTTGNTIRKFQGHTQSINCVAFNPLYNVLLTGSFDTTVRIWDLNSDRPSHRQIQTREVQILDQQRDSVSQLIVTEEQIIVGCLDGCVRVYDIRMGCMTTDDVGGMV